MFLRLSHRFDGVRLLKIPGWRCAALLWKHWSPGLCAALLASSKQADQHTMTKLGILWPSQLSSQIGYLLQSLVQKLFCNSRTFLDSRFGTELETWVQHYAW